MADNAVALRASSAQALLRLVPRAGWLDTLAAATGVILPTIAKGVILRRPAVMALAERLQFDAYAVRQLQRLRARHGSGPVLLNILGRRVAVVLDPADAHRILAQTPEPFAAATREKTAALAHFEPRNVLISEGAERKERRRYNEEALETHRPLHHLAPDFLRIVAEEAAHLHRGGVLDWRSFSNSWSRMVRRVIFGNAAAQDEELSSMMQQLRSLANWAFLAPRRAGLRARMLSRIRHYLERAEPRSLAGTMAHLHTTSRTVPEEQVPQWLFAFDPAGMASFRALALLAVHPEYARRVRAELSARQNPAEMTLLRAAVLESLRLWPTSPLILRQSAVDTAFAAGSVPAGSAFMIFTPFFHRDDERLPFAHSFAPEVWMPQETSPRGPLIPFSEGPAACPGRDLVLLLSAAMISEILNHARVRLLPSRLRRHRPVPATLNHFALRFELRPH